MLYGRTEWLEKLPPYQGGGEMISTVTMAQSTYAGLPFKFEAGTPNIEAVVGWGAALDWMNSVGMDALMAHEADLMTYGTERLTAIDGLVLFGTAPEKSAVLSFGFADLHPYDLGTLLDQQGIAVRTGQQPCAPASPRIRRVKTSTAWPTGWNAPCACFANSMKFRTRL
jgi:cysteine desulfurase/selenocysteine lyase